MQKYSVDAFLDACGAHGHLLLDVRRDDAEEDYRRALHQPFALIGGLPGADLQLNDPQVSRRHGYLQLIGGRAYYVGLNDLARGDGGGARPLSVREPLRLGGHRVRLLRGPARETPESPDDLDPLATGSASRLGIRSLVLEVMSGDAVRLRWRMNRLLVLLGSAPGCRVRLGGGTCSAVQCSLVSTPQGTWLVDLLGRGGVHLNGVQTRVARVEDGDTLQAGGCSIRLLYDHAGLLEACPPGTQANGVVRLDGAAPASPGQAESALRSGPGRAVTLRSPVPPTGEVAQALVRPAGPEEHGLGAVVLPLLGQFNQMQMQLSDQFQQAALQMFQMFTALHRDQTDLLREEFDRQHRLTEELRQLQEELLRLQAAAPRRAAASGPAPVPSAPAPAAMPGRNAASGTGLMPPAREAPATPVAAARPGDRPAANGQDVHAWLCRRMETLQQERQSGWQKILSFLVGKKPGEPVP